MALQALLKCNSVGNLPEVNVYTFKAKLIFMGFAFGVI